MPLPSLPPLLLNVRLFPGMYMPSVIIGSGVSVIVADPPHLELLRNRPALHTRPNVMPEFTYEGDDLSDLHGLVLSKYGMLTWQPASARRNVMTAHPRIQRQAFPFRWTRRYASFVYARPLRSLTRKRVSAAGLANWFWTGDLPEHLRDASYAEVTAAAFSRTCVCRCD